MYCGHYKVWSIHQLRQRYDQALSGVTHLSWKDPLSVKASLISRNSSLLPSLFRLMEPITLTDLAFMLHVQRHCEALSRHTSYQEAQV